MKGIYIAAIDSCQATEKGVITKINGQIKAFSEFNINMDFAYIKEKNVFLNDILIKKHLNKPTNFFFHRYIREYMLKDLKKYDFAYIRFSRGDLQYYNLIKLLSKNGIKVIIEIPTYPYKQQYNYLNIKHLLYAFLDILIWKKIKKYIYRIAVTSNIEYIEGVKCINIFNGIDINTLSVNKSKYDGKTINMVGIANISKWHGYDRIIRGMNSFYNKNNSHKVKFYLIGEGNEKQNLINLVGDLNLENVVEFLGVKTGDELNKELDRMHIGISSLALFRAGGGHDPIKTKEFIGRGMPVVLGYNDKLVDMNLSYVMKVEEDDSEIDINNIIYKYDNMNCNKDEIRKYAEENLSWTSQISKIVECLL